MIQLRRPLLFMALLAVLLVAAAACSNPSDPGIPTAAGSPSATPTPNATGDAVAFARCMRQHGVDMPDPGPDIQWGQLNQAPGWDAAFTACKHLLPGGVDPQRLGSAPSAQELEQLRAFAVCMRAHEIDMSDPRPDGNMIIRGRLEHVTRTQLLSDPGFKAAEAACHDKLPASMKNEGKK